MRKKIAYLLIAVLFVCQLQLPTFAAATAANNSNLEVSIRLQYPISSKAVEPMQLALLQGTTELGTIKFGGITAKDHMISIGGTGYPVIFTPLNENGEETTGEERIYTYHLKFQGIPSGTYTVKLKAEGYKTYTSEPLRLVESDKHIVVDTAKQAFTAGDINGDNAVNKEDLTAVETALGTKVIGNTYDLNKDGKLDIEDLAQTFWNIQAIGEAEIHNTRLNLGSALDEVATADAIADANKGVTIMGNVEALLDGRIDTALSLTSTQPINDANPVSIPLTFDREIKVSEVQITPGETGTPTKGEVVAYDAKGNEVAREPFEAEPTTRFRSVFATNERKTITISLGKQVPIQKITIEVTGTEGNNHLASISKIEFLEDVVDNAINQEKGSIKNLTVKEKNKEIVLNWNRVANVTGYKVQFGNASGSYTDYLEVEGNTASIKMLDNKELKNFTPYYFVVQATNGDWRGPVSQEVIGTPKPPSKPPAPTNVLLTEGDQQLQLSWGGSEVAEGWNVYYKKVTDAGYTKVANLTKTSKTIVGLENDIAYQLYATAYNGAGESGPSEIVQGTPKREALKIPKVPSHKRIDNSQIQGIRLTDASNTDKEFYPGGFDIQNVVDNNFYTHWTAATYQKARGFEVTFKKPYEMDYMAYIPRLDKDPKGGGWYKDYPYDYAISIWESEGAPEQKIVPRTRMPQSGEPGLKILPFPKSTVYKIRVELFEWNGAGVISASELMFYEYDDLIESISNLFADGTYSSLKSSVTEADIDNLKNRLDTLGEAYLSVPKEVLQQELQIAKELKASGNSSLVNELITVTQGRKASTEGDRQFANSRGINELQPTGYLSHPEEQFIVYVDAEAGKELPSIIVSQYFSGGTWKQEIPLKQGRNVIATPKLVNYNGDKGGPIYVQYLGETQQNIRIQIRNATPMPTVEVFDLTDEIAAKAMLTEYINDLTAYVAKLDSTKKPQLNVDNVTEIGTEKVLLSLPASQILKALQNGASTIEEQVNKLYESLCTWETNMELQYAVHGLSKDASESKHRWPATRFNVRYMRMSEKAFMYAAADHAGIRWGSEGEMVNGNRTSPNGYFGWGINHELGHILNLNEYIYGEITNNIFALFAQTINGGPSRLESSNVYDKVYQKVVSTNPGLSSDVFVTLGMFWQLHLAYDYTDVLGEGAQTGAGKFYPALNQAFRNDTTTGVDKENMLTRLASDVVGKDLSAFFEAWEFELTEDTKAYTSKYTEKSKAIYYLNDEARRYRLDGGTGMPTDTTVTATATVVSESETGAPSVQIAITNTAADEAMLGYEIYRDGKLIAFTTENSYVDKISTANNISYTYAVKGFDKLLSETELVDTNPVYIGTDGTLDRTQFNFTKEADGSILINMNSVQEVVGLKINTVTTGSAINVATTTPSGIKVEVSETGAEDSWVVAKEADLSSGQGLLYFNKPGTTSDDMRIWTYDAGYVRITGAQVNDLQTTDIDLLAYPGDAVYFTEGAIGRLGHDYNYNGGVIPKDSLVVLGTYRGHPVYSKMLLTGKYIEGGCDDKTTTTYAMDELLDEVVAMSNNSLSQVQEEVERAINGEMFLFAELPEDMQVSKVNNGIWLFVPRDGIIPATIKARMYRTDEATSTTGGRLVSDTIWLNVPDETSLPIINLGE